MHDNGRTAIYNLWQYSNRPGREMFMSHDPVVEPLRENSEFERVTRERTAAATSGIEPSLEASNRWLDEWTKLPRSARMRARPGPLTPADAPPGNAPRAPYLAYSTQDDPVPSLTMRGRDMVQIVPYRALGVFVHVFLDPYPQLVFPLPGVVAIVWGQGLELVKSVIGSHRCGFIQEYDPARFTPPADASAPLIERIEFKMTVN
jgi:hypothetical protein